MGREEPLRFPKKDGGHEHINQDGGHCRSRIGRRRRPHEVAEQQRNERAAGGVQTLTPEGRGETQLLCEDETDDCNARNRRVEFVIIN